MLKFNNDGHFRILTVSDFHGSTKYNPKLKIGLEALIADTKPDFVFILGDIFTTLYDNEGIEAVEFFLRDALTPIYDRNIPWAHVYGNHDRECGLSNEVQQAVYEKMPGCMSSSGPEDVSGVGNFRIPIYSNDGNDVRYNLFGLDSHSEFRDNMTDFGLKGVEWRLPVSFGPGGGNACPLPDQVCWYMTESKNAENAAGHKIPALMFMHIPLIEYNLIWRNPEETNMVGSMREGPGSCEMNSGLFLACLQRGDVRGIFSGHEHLIDYQGEYCGVTLAYDAALGYDMSAHDDLRGGRVIDIYDDGRMYTKSIKLWDILGKSCMRNPDYMEGGCRYFVRKLWK